MVRASETRQLGHDSLWNPIRQHKHTSAWAPNNSDPHRPVDSTESRFAFRVDWYLVVARPTESSKLSTQSSPDVVPLLVELLLLISLLTSSRSSAIVSGLTVWCWSGSAKSNCTGSSFRSDGIVVFEGWIADSLIGRWVFGSIPRLTSFLLMWVFQ